MKKDDKEQLLLKDLCARLPYDVMCQTDENGKIHKLKGINKYKGIWWYEFDGFRNIKLPKPYLRTMSSMTEEELKELKTLCSIYIPTNCPTIGFKDYGIIVFTHHLTNNTYSFKLNIDIIDWLNAHHFDYHDLIEKGLAIEAPDGMYGKF